MTLANTRMWWNDRDGYVTVNVIMGGVEDETDGHFLLQMPDGSLRVAFGNTLEGWFWSKSVNY